MLDLAREKGLRVGCAPDTFLGGGLQTCRKLIDDGMIGEPIGASAFMMSHGPRAGIPTPNSSTSLALARCSIWAVLPDGADIAAWPGGAA